MEQQQRLEYLLQTLLPEAGEDGLWLEKRYGRTFALLRGLMNMRQPQQDQAQFLEVQDAYLQEMTRQKGIVQAAQLQAAPLHPSLYVWQGDITTLQADAIVNAANHKMLGCWSPNHGCIDNMIHTMAGVQLRRDCALLMEQQGHDEETGQAKITPAYNLPSRYVLHTVGPVIDTQVTEQDRALLASCYRSCLELAAEYKLRSVAFCCISTGVFRFPNEDAAQIAVDTVLQFLQKDSTIEQVIFNVFQDKDLQIYQRLLGAMPGCI